MVFESGVRRKIFGPRRHKVIGRWRRLRTFMVIKSRTLIWATQVAHIGERRGAYRVLLGEPE